VVLSDRRNRVWLWVLAAVTALAGVGGARALAQGIPDAIRTKVEQLNEAEAKTVAQYVDDHSKNLLSDDPQLLKKDRDALLEPLSKSDTGVGFRIAYDRVLIPKITPMMTAPKDLVVINGLNIAGDLATDRAVDLVVGQATAKLPSVRYQAAYALERVFRAVLEGQPAASAQKLSTAVGGLEQRIAQEKDAQVLDRLIRAGLSAAKIMKPEVQLQDVAISAVSKGAAGSAKNMINGGGQQEMSAFLRAADGEQLMIAQAGGRAGMKQDTAKAAALLGGVLIGRVVKMVETKQLPPNTDSKVDPLRQTCSQMVSAAQKLIQFSGQIMQPGGTFVLADDKGAPLDLGGDVRKGTKDDDARFSTVGWDAVKAMLAKPPFAIPAEDVNPK